MGVLTTLVIGIDKKIEAALATIFQILRFVVLAICIACKFYWCRQSQRKRTLIIDEVSYKFVCRSNFFNKQDSLRECAICLSELVGGEEGRELPCKHSFHRKCVDPWLMGDRESCGTCPICRREVVSKDMVREYECVENKEEVFDFEMELALILLSTLPRRTCM